MSRRCLICSNINPCREHSSDRQDKELRRNIKELRRNMRMIREIEATTPKETTNECC